MEYLGSQVELNSEFPEFSEQKSYFGININMLVITTSLQIPVGNNVSVVPIIFCRVCSPNTPTPRHGRGPCPTFTIRDCPTQRSDTT